MNIFFLDFDPKVCAESHCDKHVVKMIIEYAQLMSTAHRVLDGVEYTDKTANGRSIKRWRMKDGDYENGLMKASHVNHPSAVWTRSSKQNYVWLNQMWTYLLSEYSLRYEKHHACEKYMRWLYAWPENIPDTRFTAPPPAMPDYCKIPDDPMMSYWKYYINEKVRFARWTKRQVPWWFTEGCLQKMVDENERLGLYEDASIHV